MLALSQNFLICLGFGPQLELKFSATPACSLFLEFGDLHFYIIEIKLKEKNLLDFYRPMGLKMS